MAELKCPHCGQAFTVDDTEVSSIIQQIRDKEFQKDLESRVSELEEHMREKHELELEAKENEIKSQDREAYEKEISQNFNFHMCCGNGISVCASRIRERKQLFLQL